jgi:hypothetical protein
MSVTCDARHLAEPQRGIEGFETADAFPQLARLGPREPLVTATVTAGGHCWGLGGWTSIDGVRQLLPWRYSRGDTAVAVQPWRYLAEAATVLTGLDGGRRGSDRRVYLNRGIFVHFCSGTRSRQDFCGASSQSCQIQPQLVQPLTVNASKRTQETVSKRRRVMALNMPGEPADF